MDMWFHSIILTYLNFDIRTWQAIEVGASVQDLNRQIRFCVLKLSVTFLCV